MSETQTTETTEDESSDGYVPMRLDMEALVVQVSMALDVANLPASESDRIDTALRQLREQLDGHLRDEQTGRALLVLAMQVTALTHIEPDEDDVNPFATSGIAVANFIAVMGLRLFCGDPNLKPVVLDDEADAETKPEADAA